MKTVAPTTKLTWYERVEKIMIEYKGYVELIRDGIAYVVLTAPDGTTIEGELPHHGEIRERRRFIMTLQDVPDKVITPEREQEIRQEVERMLGGMEDLPQSDY